MAAPISIILLARKYYRRLRANWQLVLEPVACVRDCRTLRRLGVCRVLPKCEQLVPVLRQEVRAWGTDGPGRVLQHGFLENAASHGYDIFTSSCSLPLLSVGMLRWSVGMLRRISESDWRRSASPLWSLGVVNKRMGGKMHYSAYP